MAEQPSENIDQQQIKEGQIMKPPSKQKIQSLEKIQNNRYLNQNIYLLFIQEKYEEALTLINRCKPDEYKLYMQALIYRQQFKLDKTLALLLQCQIWNKTNYHYLKAIAHNFYLLGKYKSSMEVAREAYKQNNSDYEIMYFLAKISMALGDEQGAIKYYVMAINKEPNQQSFIELAKIYINQQNYDDASRQLTRAIAISPENSQIHQLLGEVSLRRGIREQAKNHFMNSLARNSENYNTLFSMGALLQAQLEIQEALNYFKKAYALSPNSAALWNNIAANMLSKNKLIGAYSCLKRSLFLQPFKWDIHTNLGIVFMHAKKYVAAQMHFRTAISLSKNPINISSSSIKPHSSNDPYLYNLLGRCLFELGDYFNAQKSFLEGAKTQQDPNCLCNYAIMLIKQGQKDKSQKILKQLKSRTLPAEIAAKVDEILFTL